MRFKSWDNYIDAMLSQVKFRFDHGEIRQEYEEHMEDKLEFLMDCGMDEERAAREVLAEMGEPESLGKALNEIHNPLLGWIWWVSKWAAVIAVAICIFLVAKVVFTQVSAASGDYEKLKNYGKVVYQYDVDQEFSFDGIEIYIEDVQFYSSDCVAIRYIRKGNIFRRHPQYAFNFNGISGPVFHDEDGNRCYTYFYHFHNGRKTVLLLEDFPQEADYLIIDWKQHGREIYVEIPAHERLKAGEQK
ncbi:MAG: hypothetical protein IJB73_05510 [Firmicutes bacterium]|nr:hypothetical protein [Bacillota bacterium]